MASNPPTPPPAKKGGFLSSGPTIAGHKVSWAAIGSLAAVGGLAYVLWARSHGATVAAAGPAASYTLPTLDPGTAPYGSTTDYGAELSNQSQMLAALQQELQGSQVTTADTSVASSPSPAASPGFIKGDAPGAYMGPDPYQTGTSTGYGWAWEYSKQAIAANPSLASGLHFGDPPGTPGGSAVTPTPYGNSWEWGWLNQPGSLSSGLDTFAPIASASPPVTPTA